MPKSDIVERLRIVADEYQQSALEKLLEEAATEIERLRAVVERMDEIDQAKVTEQATEIETLRAALQAVRNSPDALCCLSKEEVDEIYKHTTRAAWEH